MEKVLWVRSKLYHSSTGKSKVFDGLDPVNQYLADGWKVKLISACATAESYYNGDKCVSQAYIVIEKDGIEKDGIEKDGIEKDG